MFPKALGIQPKFCMVYINHHNVGSGGALPKHTVPNCMNGLHRSEGSAEDAANIHAGFDKYLGKLMKLLSEQQEQEENRLMNQ